MFGSIHISDLSLNSITPQPSRLRDFKTLSVSNRRAGSSITSTALVGLTGKRGILIIQNRFRRVANIISTTPSKSVISIQLSSDDTFGSPILIEMGRLAQHLTINSAMGIVTNRRINQDKVVISIAFRSNGGRTILFSIISDRRLVIPFGCVTNTVMTKKNPPRGKSLPGNNSNSSDFRLRSLIALRKRRNSTTVVLHLRRRRTFILSSGSRAHHMTLGDLYGIPGPLSRNTSHFSPTIVGDASQIRFIRTKFPSNQPTAILRIRHARTFLHTVSANSIIYQPLAAISQPATCTNICTSSQRPHRTHGKRNKNNPVQRVVKGSIAVDKTKPCGNCVKVIGSLASARTQVRLRASDGIIAIPQREISLPNASTTTSKHHPLNDITKDNKGAPT